jgi:hypothetical protein
MNVHSPLILLCLSLVMTGPVEAESFSKYKNHKMYDRYFSKYAKRFFGAGFDWTHFKAQAIAESNLNIKAKSHVGAVGLMQIMPATFLEITQKNKFIAGSAGEPRWNIAAGISYNRSLWNYWRADRGFQDKLNLLLIMPGGVIFEKRNDLLRKSGRIPTFGPPLKSTWSK